MTTDLVPRIGYSPYKLWMLFCLPSQHKKCCLDTVFIEQVEHPGGVLYDPRLHSCPILPSHDLVERGYMVVIFHVDGKRVLQLFLTQPKTRPIVPDCRDPTISYPCPTVSARYCVWDALPHRIRSCRAAGRSCSRYREYRIRMRRYRPNAASVHIQCFLPRTIGDRPTHDGNGSLAYTATATGSARPRGEICSVAEIPVEVIAHSLFNYLYPVGEK